MADDAYYLLRPLGVVCSPLRERADAPRQGSEGAPDAWIVLEPSVADALQGIRAGDRLVLVTWLHEADRSVLQVHPRDDESRPLTGVFATRSSASIARRARRQRSRNCRNVSMPPPCRSGQSMRPFRNR